MGLGSKLRFATRLIGTVYTADGAETYQSFALIGPAMTGNGRATTDGNAQYNNDQDNIYQSACSLHLWRLQAFCVRKACAPCGKPQKLSVSFVFT